LDVGQIVLFWNTTRKGDNPDSDVLIANAIINLV
jgi:hypothetical protein